MSEPLTFSLTVLYFFQSFLTILSDIEVVKFIRDPKRSAETVSKNIAHGAEIGTLIGRAASFLLILCLQYMAVPVLNYKHLLLSCIPPLFTQIAKYYYLKAKAGKLELSEEFWQITGSMSAAMCVFSFFVIDFVLTQDGKSAERDWRTFGLELVYVAAAFAQIGSQYTRLEVREQARSLEIVLHKQEVLQGLLVQAIRILVFAGWAAQAPTILAYRFVVFEIGVLAVSLLSVRAQEDVSKQASQQQQQQQQQIGKSKDTNKALKSE